MDPIETVSWHGKSLVHIISAHFVPDRTTFVTPPDYKQQVGYIVYPAKAKIQRHVHRKLQRRIVGTSEVLVVRRGQCVLEIYSDELELVATRELHEGDIVIMVGGGHGFSITQDTVFLEIKQGPYTGIDEKQVF